MIELLQKYEEAKEQWDNYIKDLEEGKATLSDEEAEELEDVIFYAELKVEKLVTPIILKETNLTEKDVSKIFALRIENAMDLANRLLRTVYL